MGTLMRIVGAAFALIALQFAALPALAHAGHAHHMQGAAHQGVSHHGMSHHSVHGQSHGIVHAHHAAVRGDIPANDTAATGTSGISVHADGQKLTAASQDGGATSDRCGGDCSVCCCGSGMGCGAAAVLSSAGPLSLPERSHDLGCEQAALGRGIDPDALRKPPRRLV